MTFRVLGGPESWAWVNLMKFNKAMCKVLHLFWSNPKYSLDREWIEGILVVKDLGMLVVEKLNIHQHARAVRNLHEKRRWRRALESAWGGGTRGNDKRKHCQATGLD